MSRDDYPSMWNFDEEISTPPFSQPLICGTQLLNSFDKTYEVFKSAVIEGSFLK